MRIFTSAKPGFTYWACHGLIWGSLAFYVSVLFAIIFQCHPIWVLYGQHDKDHCLDWKLLLVVSSAIDVVLDFMTLLLAVWITRLLEMTTKMKVGAVAIFATGLL